MTPNWRTTGANWRSGGRLAPVRPLKGPSNWRSTPPPELLQRGTGAGTGAQLAQEAIPATLSPCGTLATVHACPRCCGVHVHGWSGDAEFDARPRPPLCDRAAQPYRISTGPAT